MKQPVETLTLWQLADLSAHPMEKENGLGLELHFAKVGSQKALKVFLPREQAISVVGVLIEAVKALQAHDVLPDPNQ